MCHYENFRIEYKQCRWKMFSQSIHSTAVWTLVFSNLLSKSHRKCAQQTLYRLDVSSLKSSVPTKDALLVLCVL